MIIFNEKGVKVDLQNTRKQGAKVEKLIFHFVDSLVKMIYARRQKANCFFSEWLIFCPRSPNILVKVPFIIVFISVDHASILGVLFYRVLKMLSVTLAVNYLAHA